MVKVTIKAEKKKEKNWGVKRIINKRKSALGGFDYLLEWQDWVPGDYQWMHEGRLNCPLLLKKFEQSLLATPKNQKPAARKPAPSTAPAKVTKTPAAVPRRRSARIKEKLGDDDEESAAEADASCSKMPQKRHQLLSSSSAEDEETPSTKTAKVATGSAVSPMITTRVLRKRPQASPNYSAKRRSAPAKVEASSAKNNDTPMSGGGAASSSSTPARVTRPRGRPRSTVARKSATKNTVSKVVTKKAKRRVAESEENEVDEVDEETVDLDINLENNVEVNKEQNAIQEEAHTEERVIKQEEPEVISAHDNIVPNESYKNVEVKEEEIDLDSIANVAVEESVPPKEQVAPKSLEDLLKAIVDEEDEVNKEKGVEDGPTESGVGDVSKETQLANQVDSVGESDRDNCDVITGDAHEGSIDHDQPILAPEGNPLSRVLPSADTPSADTVTEDRATMDKAYETIMANLHAQVLMDELVSKVSLSEVLDSANFSIVGVESRGGDIAYKLKDFAGETFLVESVELLKHPNVKDAIIGFWQHRYISNDDI